MVIGTLSQTQLRLRIILSAGLTLYVFSWLIAYGQTPLGRFPALDCLQNQVLAQQIVAGALPEEPFHRAPLYPLILAGLLKLVGDVAWLPDIGRLLNGLAVLGAAACAFMAARRLWRSEWAALLAAVLVGANPVILFFAGDLYDITLATLIAAACVWAWVVWVARPGLGLTLVIGGLLGVGIMLRSHLLPWAVLWPVIALCLGGKGKRRGAHAALAVVGPVLALLATGAINLTLTDTWRTSPWQGAYALWAGNEAGADGRIYKQSRAVEHGSEFDNPAKLLSIELYAEATGAEPPYDIDAMNRYWLEQTAAEIASDPLRWLGLMLRKGYYFLNSYEQYDNRTYGLHQTLHPHLAWNPIHWGLLVLLTVAALFVPRGSAGPIARVLALVFVAYAAGVVLFYASNRFRVPLLPLLAVAGSGVVGLPTLVRLWRPVRQAGTVSALAGVAVLLYTGWFDARKTDTWEADYLMLARAATQAGDDRQSLAYVEEALELNPESRQARLLQILGNFNLWALQDIPLTLPTQAAAVLYEQARAQADWSHEAAAVAGIYAWKLGREGEALDLWRRFPESAFCWMGRVWVGPAAELPSAAAMEGVVQGRYGPWLEAALKARGAAEPLGEAVWLTGVFQPAQ